MPELLVGYLLPWVVSGLGAIGVSSAAIVASAVLITQGLTYLALGAAALLAYSVFAPSQPATPKPEDGKYNLKQSVPPLVYVLGRVKKGGDYAFLEEKGGIAHHITVWAAHHIQGFVQHYLHDEAVTLDGNNVVLPEHFVHETNALVGTPKVQINTRLGADVGTAYGTAVNAFPGIWTNDHRGDGLATVYMRVQTVPSEDLQKVFPNHMPLHTAVGQGHDRLLDPRTNTRGYSENLAIHRYWHLTHPVGGKLSRADMYDPDWEHAADVCDQIVTNRDGAPEPRYHGGMWFRANNDPIQIGRLMDQAAELVIYERADGLVGVHAGEYTEPDIRLTANDIVSLGYDPNMRRASNVLAVRGRFTDPDKGYVTTDAAIYGDPYPTDDERTKTVENQAVQRHNHIQRLQKIAEIRANAARVKMVAHYEPARNVPYRRFIRVHLPPKLNEAVIEITGRPTLSLRNLTYEFEGIVVPPTLYAFNAATEEGEPPATTEDVERQDVPEPDNFQVTLDHDVVSGGVPAAYGEASFDLQDESFQYEVQWQKTTGGPRESVFGGVGDLLIRTGYLADGSEYRFRARTWSSGTSSRWTDYIVLQVTADPVAPGAIQSITVTGGLGRASVGFTAPSSNNVRWVTLYRVPAGGTLDRNTHRVTDYLVLPNGTYSAADGDTAPVNLLGNPGFSGASVWTLGANWAIGGGTANKTAGASGTIQQAVADLTSAAAGTNWRWGVTVTSVTGGSLTSRLLGGTTVQFSYSTTGTHVGTLTKATGNTDFGVLGAAATAGSIDNAVLFQETPTCAPQGAWDYYLEPANGSYVAGPLSGPYSVIVY